MKPDQGAFAAAKRDVLEPWNGNVTKTFKGTFAKGGKSTRANKFDLTLDGSLKMRLHGPRKTNYNLHATSNGGDQGTSKTPDTRDSFRYEAACREDSTEHVTITVKRIKGSGPFTLRVNYAG